MHVGFEIENQVHHEDPQSKKHEQPRVASADSTTFRFGLARGMRQPEATQAKPPCPYLTTSPIFHRKRCPEPQIPLHGASYKLYYVN